jgi:predicted MPP superfamily phosphohydrolase
LIGGDEVVDPDRREWLKTVGIFTPVALFGGLAATNGRQSGRFAVNRYDLPAPWLPQRLRGLTITHVSDLHVGRLYRPYMLPRLVDEVNRLDGDLVMVTGDIVDLSNDVLPETLDAIRQFGHRHGRFMCLGNHDLIDDREEFIRGVRAAGLDLLVDENRILDIGGERITVGAIDWTGRADGQAATSYEKRARSMQWDYRAGDHGPFIALAHHPHAFDAMAARKIPLTLSGHTHGGQLMFRAPRTDGRGDAERDSGVGKLLFKYLRGFYFQGGSTLFVNSGVGNWFPIRVNAPAEIVQIRLV